MYRTSSIAGAIALTLVVAMAASCDDDDTIVTLTDDAGGGGTLPPGADAAAPSDAGAADVVLEPVQDSQIAQVLLTVNQRELQQGRIVQTYAITPVVEEYAARMVAEHTAINERQEALFVMLALIPTDSSTSRQLQSESDAVVEQLQRLPSDFERIYIDAQLAGHAELLNLIDRQLLPAASSEELETELVTMRDVVQAHFDAALTLQTTSGLYPPGSL